MRIAITFLLFWFSVVLLQASIYTFSPIVRNYLVSDYNAGIQNWAIAQDERGGCISVITVGCWNLMEVLGGCMNYRQKELCSTIYRSEDGRIYVGSYEEFGYFVRTPYDTLEYHSLKEIGRKILRFIMTKSLGYCLGSGEIVFQSFGFSFFYNGNSVEGIRMKNLPLNLFQVKYFLFSKNKWWTLCLCW